MTYKQIELLEGYIQNIEELKDAPTLKGKDYFNSAKTLDKIIAAGVKEYCTNINWNDVSFYDASKMQYVYNDDTTRGYLEIMKHAIQGVLFACPNYKKICAVREVIFEGENIKKDEDKNKFIIKIATQYNGCIEISKAVQSYVQKSIEGTWIEEETTGPIFNALLGQLRIYLDELCIEKKENNNTKSPSITMIQQQQNSQSVTNTISITIEDCIKDLSDCFDVEDNEAEQIKKQLLEIKELLKEKRGNGKSIRNKIASILKWVADKSSAAMIAILPTLMNFLQSNGG